MSLEFQLIPVTPLQQNATLLWDSATKEAVLTDPGGDVDVLSTAILSRQLTLKAIWLTHGHADHAGAAMALARQFKATILGPHRDDEFWLQQIDTISRMYGIAGAQNCRPDRWLDEGDQLYVGNFLFQVLHIPGHTPGSVVFYHADMPLLIGGDVLFRGSVGRADFPRSDADALLRNIKDKLYVLPDATQVITGHGAMTTIGYEKQHNPFVRSSF